MAFQLQPPLFWLAQLYENKQLKENGKMTTATDKIISIVIRRTRS